MPIIADLYLTIIPYTALYTQIVPEAVIATSESNVAGRTAIVLDFNAGAGLYSRDIGTEFNWPTNAGTELFVWQPSVIQQPENIYGRPTDWIDGGNSGAKFVQGITLQANTFGVQKTFFLQSADDLSLHALFEAPATFNGQSVQAFSCAPFVAHSVRIVSTDGVPWQVWNQDLVFQPWPEACLDWHTELSSFGMIGWNHAREMNVAYVSSGVLTCVLAFDAWPSITFTLPSSGGLQAKTKVTLPPNKWKLMGLHINSPSLFNVFQSDVELKIKDWGSEGPYQVLRPFGGKSSTGALV